MLTIAVPGSSAKVTQPHYSAVASAVYVQEAVNRSLAEAAAPCINEAITGVTSDPYCFDAATGGFVRAVDLLTAALNPFVDDGPGATCRGVISKYLDQISAINAGVTKFRAAARSHVLIKRYDSMRFVFAQTKRGSVGKATALSERMLDACSP